MSYLAVFMNNFLIISNNISKNSIMKLLSPKQNVRQK